jgi:hypothetical protein
MSITVETQGGDVLRGSRVRKKDTNSFLEEQAAISAAACSGIQFIWQVESTRDFTR